MSKRFLFAMLAAALTAGAHHADLLALPGYDIGFRRVIEKKTA